jgi:NAD(P)H-quinone oxidoreductase subunit 6
MNVADALFYAVAALVVGSAAVVAFSRNIVYSAFALLGTLTGVAATFVFLAADFLAVVQVMVYVGGVLTLLLFAVMMTHRIVDPQVSNMPFGRWTALSMGVVLGGILIHAFVSTPWSTQVLQPTGPTTRKLGDALLGEYLLPFEVAGFLLLVALIGAAVLARNQVRQRFGEDEAPAPTKAEGHS